ncbi:MAG: hypothetical protein RR764_07700 [Oscillospiraceae bacterium]
MKRKILKHFLSSAMVLMLFMATCAPAYALFGKNDKTVEFIFSQKSTVFARNKNGSPKPQAPIATPYWSGLAEDVTGYTVTYKRTHTGDGKALKNPDKAVEEPTQAGTYTAVITFGDNVKFVNPNGEKTQEYPRTFVIKKAQQPAPILRSACAALIDNEERTGGSIEPGASGVISTRWASGTKPVYMWTTGSGTVVKPETGKPARFTSIAAGEAVLSVRLPEDNNYIKSDAVTYTVKVNGDINTGDGFVLRGEKLNESGWFVSDVAVEPQNGFQEVIVAEDNPVTFEGESVINIVLKTADGKATEPEAVTVKKDTTAPVVENIMINDSPWSEAPLSENAWAAATKLVITAQIRDDISGIGKVEYSVDGAEFISDANAVFAEEGIKKNAYSHTLETKAEHTLSLRVTDFAGNETQKTIAITAPVISAESAPTSSSVAPAPSSAAVEDEPITEPNEAMKAVSERLEYLIRCNIEAAVAGDVRANQAYIEESLGMYTALSQKERKSLGAQTLEGLKEYFIALYKIKGKDAAEIEALFTFKEESKPIVSSSLNSAEQNKEESIPHPSSVSKPTASSAVSAQSQSTVSAQSGKSEGTNPFMIFVPIIVLLAAVTVYFVWKKRENIASDKQSDNSEAQNAEPHDDYSDFDNFDDFKQ